MICLSIALTRLPHLSHAAFLTHWRDVHAPLVVSLASDLGIRRYLQLHGFGDEVGAALGVRPSVGANCDGVAQIWYEDENAATRVRDTPAGKAAIAQLRRDEALFIARERSIFWWGQPHLVIG